jgi:hypothetical protein
MMSVFVFKEMYNGCEKHENASSSFLDCLLCSTYRKSETKEEVVGCSMPWLRLWLRGVWARSTHSWEEAEGVVCMARDNALCNDARLEMLSM